MTVKRSLGGWWFRCQKGSGKSKTQEPPPVKKYHKPAAAAQAPAVENQELCMTLLRDSLRTVAEQRLMAEVAALCGPSHFPQPDAIYRRAGSERGTCHAGGARRSDRAAPGPQANGRWHGSGARARERCGGRAITPPPW